MLAEEYHRWRFGLALGQILLCLHPQIFSGSSSSSRVFYSLILVLLHVVFSLCLSNKVNTVQTHSKQRRRLNLTAGGEVAFHRRCGPFLCFALCQLKSMSIKMHNICDETQLHHLMLDLAYAAVVRAAAKSAFVTEWNEEKSFDNIFLLLWS